jgi:hypothetical protein
MAIRRSNRIGAATVAVAIAAMLAASSPAAANSVMPADTDLTITGGDASAAIVCGNVAVAQDLARQRHIVLQRAKCTAAATGGSVALSNVDIFVSSSALALNRGNPLLAAFTAARPPGVAQDSCDNHRPGSGKQLNKCFALAHGGRLNLRNVSQVVHGSDGVTTTQTIANASIQVADGGSADAACENVVSDPLDQRDDCTGDGGGADWSMRRVDVTIHNPDGSTSTRHGINVEVRGGSGTANVFCFNVTDGSGRVIQINICNANAQGGDATLQNVTIHTS